MNRFVLIIVCLCLWPLTAHASDDHDDDDDDHKTQAQLNAAIERGEILSLSDILERVKSRLEGRIVEIEFEREDGRPIYEIYVLRKDGRRLEYEIDARTAQILDLKDED
ncbi:PepSY domain-containing protein [Hoeflea sp.]|uniref:PepSY domain-containing protein n=1 Tax=Hoeflea sp. TaxID=1940281 RepID=UPI003749FADF